MEIYNGELDVFWLSGAQIGYVDSLAGEESDGGNAAPVNRQVRPLMQATFGTLEASEVRAMFGNTRSGSKAFFIRPPLDSFRKVTGATLGTATGSEQIFQLKIALGAVTWDALYPDPTTLIVYDDGSPLVVTTDYTLGDLGVVTLLAGITAGHTITATFEYKTAVRFVDPQLSQTIETVDREEVQSLTVREIPA